MRPEGVYGGFDEQEDATNYDFRVKLMIPSDRGKLEPGTSNRKNGGNR